MKKSLSTLFFLVLVLTVLVVIPTTKLESAIQTGVSDTSGSDWKCSCPKTTWDCKCKTLN